MLFKNTNPPPRVLEDGTVRMKQETKSFQNNKIYLIIMVLAMLVSAPSNCRMYMPFSSETFI